MTKEIKKVGVIGAGTMGSGIAAQLANAGIEVVLLDKFPGFSEKSITRMKAAKPTDVFNAGFMVPENARHITPGTVDDNFNLLQDCDWVIETALFKNESERADLYKKLEATLKPDAIISSNTSTMPIADLTNGQSMEFKKRFLNTHFFNPVRFMHLLEVISSPDTDPELTNTLLDFSSRVAGKKPVHCKDARGFIANRIGVFAMERAHHEALAQGLGIEDVDAIMGKAFGFPKLGLFKLADEVGLPVIDHVRSDLKNHLPETDHFQSIFTGDADMKDMLANGYLGNRNPQSKGGYYRSKIGVDGKPALAENGKPEKESRDLVTGEYRSFQKSPYFEFDKKIKKYGSLKNFFQSSDTPARFAWPVMRDLMLYVLEHAEELAYDLQDIDDAMRAGFNWELGPFQLLDKIGVGWFIKKLEEEGTPVPALLAKTEGRNFYRKHDKQNQVMNFDGTYAAIKRTPGTLHLADIKAASQPLITHNSASLWDIGDGVVALEFHCTQNLIDPSIFWVINESIKLVESNPDRYKGMVIYNDAKNFSFGANLKLVEIFMDASKNSALKTLGIGSYVEKNLYKMVEELVYQGQAVYRALRHAPFPVVGAPVGTPENKAFGGACEILMHCDAIQSGPEQIIALPEASLGLIPGWGGTTLYLERAAEKPGQIKGPMAPVIEAGMALANPLASGASCAQDARKKLWLSPDDGISLDYERVLADAKTKALALAESYQPKPLPTFTLPGITGKGAIRMNVDKLYQMGDNPAKGGVNHVDVKVIDALADILTGGEELRLQDVDSHVAHNAVASKLKQIMAERGENSIAVHAGIALTLSRMLQLERDRFLDRFRDKAAWKRIHHTLAAGSPLRENHLENPPSPHEIRRTITKTDLPRREVTGKPLNGADEKRLRAMADMTAEFYKLNAQKSALGTAVQAPKTVAATLEVFQLLKN